MDPFTVWGTPGLISERSRPDLGAIATLTATFAVEVRTGDEYPGAEPVDAIQTGMLARGFGLLARGAPGDLVALPVLTGWHAALGHAAGPGELVVEVGTDAETFYAGDVGAGVPDGWAGAAVRRGLLVVLVCSGVDLFGADRTEAITRAIADGRTVGAEIPATTRTG